MHYLSYLAPYSAYRHPPSIPQLTQPKFSKLHRTPKTPSGLWSEMAPGGRSSATKRCI